MPIRPILLKGHSRPLTSVKFNRQGDLLFTCAKDNKPNVWYADNGERLGTYNGHNGTVWDLDINWSTTRLITGSADQSAKLWDVESGKQLYHFPHKSGVRSVAFSHGETLLLTAQDSTFGSQPTIFVYNLEKDISQQSDVPVRSFSTTENRENIIDVLWGSLNSTIISAGYDGAVRLWDVETGQELRKVVEHKKQINNVQFSKDHSMIITASSDYTAKIFDARTLELIKTYQSDRPLNSAAISPIMNHVIVGGGQEAMRVTESTGRVGHFEVDFFHLVYQEFLGSVKGHFGPVNTVAFSPTGKAFASGAEDGYIRLHQFDRDYFNPKNNAL